MSLSPFEIDSIADALAERVAARLAGRVSDDAMIDARGVAALLGCSVPTVERLTKSGAIKSYKFGRLRRYKKSEILKQNGGCE